MSAMGMILTATMVIAGDGPEKVSGEIAKPQRLDLRGEWEVELVGYFHARYFNREELYRALRIQDKGEGSLRMAIPSSSTGDLVFIPCTGTYHQEKDRVVIDYRFVSKKDSEVYGDRISHGCIILYRVKSSE